jgi:uroporphyrin-III C-methyltransferase/precorrin-2 dehydrogenase/sirohydrochlorin ferrochelatase
MEISLYPMFLDLSGRHCLVLGSGPEAARKVALLERCGARVVLCAALADAPPLNGLALAIAAGAPPDDAWALAGSCRQLGIPVNVMDEPRLCSFVMPAIVDRAPVMVAISTGGRSPLLAKLLREVLDRALPARLGALAAFAGRFRGRVRHAIADPAVRLRFWHTVLTGPIAARVLGGREQEAATTLQNALVNLGDGSREPDAA